jgi:hypothetical protein
MLRLAFSVCFLLGLFLGRIREWLTGGYLFNLIVMRDLFDDEGFFAFRGCRDEDGLMRMVE